MCILVAAICEFYATKLTIQEIIANRDNIYRCAKAFRNDANTLMLQLAIKFDFNLLDCGAWPLPVYKTNHNNKGILNEDWTFYLHGSHCRFDNLQTGQIVEVRYTEKPEFGCLEGYFFCTYMQTTEEFKHLADWFINHQNVYAAIEVLSEVGTLTKKPSIMTGDYILAL